MLLKEIGRKIAQAFRLARAADEKVASSIAAALDAKAEQIKEYISTHSLTRRLTAILFNKNRFVQFIFIALYQSPPTTSPPSSFFSPYFLIFSKNIRCESPEDW